MKSKTWLNKRKVQDAVRQASVKPLARAAMLVEAEAKKLLSVGGGVKVGQGKRDDRGKFLKAKIQRVPSTPPNPPHAQTGNLRSSIKSAETEKGTWLVGPTTQAWYGQLHEFGLLVKDKNGKSVYFPPRPFMRPALRNVQVRFPALFRNLPLSSTEAGKRPNKP